MFPDSVKHLERAGTQLREHVGVAAELAVREDADLDLAVALALDGLDGLAHADVRRVRDRDVVGPLQRELGSLGEHGLADGSQGAGGGRALDEAAASGLGGWGHGSISCCRRRWFGKRCGRGGTLAGLVEQGACGGGDFRRAQPRFVLQHLGVAYRDARRAQPGDAAARTASPRWRRSRRRSRPPAPPRAPPAAAGARGRFEDHPLVPGPQRAQVDHLDGRRRAGCPAPAPAAWAPGPRDQVTMVTSSPRRTSRPGPAAPARCRHRRPRRSPQRSLCSM
jgi:hypothetical protein